MRRHGAVGDEVDAIEHDLVVDELEAGRHVRRHRLVLLDHDGAVGEARLAAIVAGLRHGDVEIAARRRASPIRSR